MADILRSRELCAMSATADPLVGWRAYNLRHIDYPTIIPVSWRSNVPFGRISLGQARLILASCFPLRAPESGASRWSSRQIGSDAGVAADVAGYSRLRGLDEVGTARALREHRAVTDALLVIRTVGATKLIEPSNPEGNDRGER